jgi:hypothetical protein
MRGVVGTGVVTVGTGVVVAVRLKPDPTDEPDVSEDGSEPRQEMAASIRR